ncbi:MAG: LptA/OstA family protein [Opitutales bacterium]
MNFRALLFGMALAVLWVPVQLMAQENEAEATQAPQPDPTPDATTEASEPAAPRRSFSGISAASSRADSNPRPRRIQITPAPAASEPVTPPTVAAPSATNATRASTPASPRQATSLDEKTVITSDGGFEVYSSPEQNRFVFFDNVEIRAGDFYARCERMEVVSNRRIRDEDAAIGQIGQIESIIATGDVRITQAGRIATCQRAEIYPDKGLAYLKENPVVLDGDTRITGYEMVLDRNAETVRILPRPEGGGAEVEIPEAVRTGALPGAEDAPEQTGP